MKLDTLYINIAKLITSSLDINTILKSIMMEVEQTFHPQNWSLFRYDPASEELFFTLAKGLDWNAVKGMRFKLGEGVVGTAAAKKECMYVVKAKENNNFSSKVDQATGFSTESLVAAPMVFQGELLGVIELINMADKFGEYERIALQVIADFSAIALNNANIHHHTMLRSFFDPLTGAYNRSKLETLIKHYQNDNANYHHRYSDRLEYIFLTYIDVNDFKSINDNYGHAKGDQVLQDLSGALMSSIRKDDYLFRLGGDEFLLLFDHLDKKELKEIHHSATEKLARCAKKLTDVSFAYGTAQGHQTEIAKLIQIADQNMYQHKTQFQE